MRLLSIKFDSFMQFKGKQEITFSEKNGITVIRGGGGRGKTGIYRGFVFGLFGEKTLVQDVDKGSDVIFTNISSVEENKQAKASVKVAFEHSGDRYVIKRGLACIKNVNGYSEQKDSAVMKITSKDGEVKIIKSEDAIASKINKIVDRKLKDSFFIDAENIEKIRKLPEKEFITALAQLAVRSSGALEMPLFMDSPFGGLDDKHRLTFINTIPEYASQLILTINAEMGQREASYLTKTNKWEKAYDLIADGKNTVIKEVAVSEFIRSLGKGEVKCH